MTKTIILLGSTGYIGSAFAATLRHQGRPLVTVPTKGRLFGDIIQDISSVANIGLVINCAAFIPSPSVDLCGQFPELHTRVNLALPVALASFLAKNDIPFAQISTGCFYDEAEFYPETAEPTRSFAGDAYAGNYLAIKWLVEKAIERLCAKAYIWRIRIPFDHISGPRNFLTKIAQYPMVWKHLNSLTHRWDFVGAAIRMYDRKAEYGTYHMVNPVPVTTEWILERMLEKKIITKMPELVAGRVPGTRLNNRKMMAVAPIRTGHEAVIDALQNWKV